MKSFILSFLLFILVKTGLLHHDTRPGVSTAQHNVYGAGNDYDLDHPQKKWELPAQLFEISGISWLGDDRFLAIEDLHPYLYLLNLKGNKTVVEKTIPFKEGKDGKKFDVEDIAVVNNIAYALWSHGAIYKITGWQSKPQAEKIKSFLSKENNTEGLCYDPVTGNLLVACKNDAHEKDEKKSTRAIYAYSIKTDSFLPDPVMTIQKSDFKKFLGESEKFYPSAIAVHPVTHDIYILSTKKTKCMAVFSHDGVLKNFVLIDKAVLPQPEGICFSPTGTLYIATEGKAGGHAFIYQFENKP